MIGNIFPFLPPNIFDSLHSTGDSSVETPATGRQASVTPDWYRYTHQKCYRRKPEKENERTLPIVTGRSFLKEKARRGKEVAIIQLDAERLPA